MTSRRGINIGFGNRGDIPLIALGLAGETNSKIAIVDNTKINGCIGTIGIITTATPADVHEAMSRSLTGGCLPPKESFRGDIFHASQVVGHIQSEAPDDATSERICRALFSIRGGEMHRTPWMTTMGGRQTITKIVASIEEHASRVTMRDVEDFFNGRGETVEGFDGGWFSGLGFAGPTVPSDSMWSANPIEAWLALAGVLRIPDAHFGWRGNQATWPAETHLLKASDLLRVWASMGVDAPDRIGVSQRVKLPGQKYFSGVLGGHIIENPIKSKKRIFPVGVDEIAKLLVVTPEAIRKQVQRGRSKDFRGFVVCGGQCWDWWTSEFRHDCSDEDRNRADSLVRVAEHTMARRTTPRVLPAGMTATWETINARSSQVAVTFERDGASVRCAPGWSPSEEHDDSLD